MNQHFDITVIGSGPGGYVAAIRAAQLGYKTALIEKYATLGGTCTNVGCIPSKALLDSSEHFYQAKTSFHQHGIETNGITLTFSKMMERKRAVIRQNTEGLNYLMSKNKIEVIQGKASFITPREIRVQPAEGTTRQITSRYFIIATGSKPASLPGIPIDKKRVISSTEALSFTEKPKELLIIGGGVIGVELASVYNRIGTSVTIIEYLDTLLPTMDRELGKALAKILKKEGVRVLTGHELKSIESRKNAISAMVQAPSGSQIRFGADYALMAVGRRPYTEGLGLENIAIQVDKKGRIVTNEKLQTSEPHIYAIGDVTFGPMLAHKAEEEGVFVAETINGQKPHIKYELIPGVVYTWPEIASAGSSEEQLKSQNIPYRVGRFPFSASGRARASGDTDGFVKVLSEPRYGKVLGVHIIGARAADLIAQAVVAMEYEVTDLDLSAIAYAHPTYSEALKEAFLGASGKGMLNF